MSYNTIASYSDASFVEKKSEFIGHIMPVKTNDEAVEFINKIKSENRKATHNVYAYIVRDGNISRYSDDGEPQGTAGVPVLDVLKKEGLTDVCCVVTRYFGGILLGGGGLVRAYSHSASIAVNSAQRVIMLSCYKFDITVDYNLYGKLTYAFPGYEVKIVDTVFDTDVTVSLYAKSEIADKLEKDLVELTNGNIKICKSDEMEADFA